jgi:hypothetical protein
VGVKFQGSFTSGTYFRTKVSIITSRVNCQSNSSKGRYAIGRGSVFAFGLLALTNQGRVFAVGWVIVGLLVIGSALGRVRKCRNGQHSRGNGRSKVGNVGRTDTGLLATGRTGSAFLYWVPELPVLGLLVTENLAYTTLG